MSEDCVDNQPVNEPWQGPGLHRDGERLAKALPRLPAGVRKKLRPLIRDAYALAESGETLAEHEQERGQYELSLKLEGAWLEISSVGHARDTWIREGRLFSIHDWKGPTPLRGIDADWLEGLTVIREEFQLEAERRSVWFHTRAQERLGDPVGQLVREYDPTEAPSYEFVWDD